MEHVRLKDVCTLINGRAYKQEELLSNGKYPVLRVGNFFSDKDFYYSDLELDEDKYCDNGDLLFAWSASFGPKIWTGEKVIYHYHIWKMVLSDRVDKEYLYYYLLYLSERIKAEGHGGIMIHTTKAEMEEREILLPSLEQQKEFVRILNRMQTIIQNRKVEVQKLDDLIKARFVEMFGDVIHNDKSWNKYVFSDITESRLGKMLDSKKQTGQFPYPYLANANVQWFRFDVNNLNTMDFSEDDREEFALEDGDLMVCEGGEIGRCAVWHNQIQPCYFQKAIHRVRCNRDVILPDYLSWWFKYNCDYHGFADIEGAKATISHLPGAKMKKLQVVVPDIEAQKQFADFVEQVDKSKSVVQDSLDEAQLLFDSLMQKYFG